MKQQKQGHLCCTASSLADENSHFKRCLFILAKRIKAQITRWITNLKEETAADGTSARLAKTSFEHKNQLMTQALDSIL